MSDFQFAVLAPAHVCGRLNKPALAISAARANAIGILDIADLDAATCFTEIASSLKLLRNTVKEGTFGIKCAPSDSSLAFELLEKSGIEKSILIVSATSNLDAKSLKNLPKRAKKSGIRLAIEVTNLESAIEAEKLKPNIIIAKGEESSGLVASETTFILVQLLTRHIKSELWARGAIGEHSIAALKAIGIGGCLLDSQLYLAKDSQVPDRIKRLIESFDGTQTTIFRIGRAGYRFYRPKKDLNQNLDVTSELCFRKYLEKNELLPLGQDAVLAKSLYRKGGTVSGIINILKNSIENYPVMAAQSNPLSPDSALSQSHGTKYPIVQGAMTRVSDNADFASAVANNGALPFLALSLMRGADVESLLDETKRALKDKPWGVGILGFLPQNLREEQLSIINKFKPPFALIAGGRPDQARALEENGTSTYLHVPSPLILKSFIEMGAKRFVFEGNECGGHVGPRSSFLLWEEMIEVLLEHKNEGKNNSEFHILFAGGIHDALSAKMVATMSSPLSEIGMKVGVLVGTAYLFTEEAVSTGAIVEEFQKRALSCGKTVLLETGPGHAIRCIDSPYKTEFETRKETLCETDSNKTSVKEKLELMHLGRLRIASKGLERDGSKLNSVDSSEQWSKGMYMIGQLAAMKDKTQSMKELHEEISLNGSQLLLKDSYKTAIEPEVKNKENEPIAIVGMSCNLPLSNDVESFWKLVINKVDAVEEVPATHWIWQDHYDTDRFKEDKAISKWGGFIKDIVFDPGHFGIPPKSFESIDPVQLLMLEAVKNALEDAGYGARSYPKSKTSMILANAGHGPIAAEYAFRSMLNGTLKELIDDDTKQRLREALPDWTEDTFPGNLSNVTAGRVTNRFDLGGINFCVDAACASSLAALYVSINDLRSKSSDLVVLGAADTHNQPFDYLNFSKTHALSESGRCKTFDSKADGIVLGEGIAAVILKRLSDAERDGDRIYALIRGAGGSSDGRALSLTAPRAQGQMTALVRAYDDAGVTPCTVGLVEAHGTGTVAGDKAEVQALTSIFKADGAENSSCAIGSVKTNIGHTKCTAGLASIIKVAKSLHHKVLPPTIGVENPSPACKFGDIPFYINTEARPWVHSKVEHPRRAAVSAFGFGGTNFHAVLEEYVNPIKQDNNFVLDTWENELFVFRAETKEKLLSSIEKLELLLERTLKDKAQTFDDDAVSTDGRRLLELSRISFENSSKNAPYSLSIIAGSLEELEIKLAESKKLTRAADGNFKTPNGIYHSVSQQENKIAFLFPGQGSQRVNMLKDLALYFPEIREQFEAADRLFGNKFSAPLSSYVYPAPSFSESDLNKQKESLDKTEIAQPALGVADIAIAKILNSFGITYDVVAGHSWGEYIALWQAGVIAENDLMNLSCDRGRILESTEKNGVMLAVSTSLDATRDLLENSSGVYVANYNSPNQTVVSGTFDQLESFAKKAKSEGVATRPVRVSRAFHSPLMKEAAQALRARLEDIPFQKPLTPIFSNRSGRLYESDSDTNIKDILESHTIEPVMFAQQIENMHEYGVKTFVEVGPGSVLTSLVDSILNGKDFTALSVERNGVGGLTQFLKLLAQLWSLGHSVDLSRLYEGRSDLNSSLERSLEKKERRKKLLYKVNSSNIVQLGADREPNKPVKLESPEKSSLNRALKQALSKEKHETISTPPSTPSFSNLPNELLLEGNQTESLLLEYQKNMLDMTNRFVEAQKEVMLAYLNQRGETTTPLETPRLDLEKKQAEKKVQDAGPVISEVKNEVIAEPASETLISRLYEIVSERTGYPIEMLEPHLDLEADLGIDSIKKIEIFNSFRKVLPESIEFDLEENLEELSALKTLDSISEWIKGFSSRKMTNKVSAVRESSVPTASDTSPLAEVNPEFYIEKLYEIVSERTGYPGETLEAHLDLEADLGIDSIKKIEIFNSFRKILPDTIEFDFESDFEKLVELKTLDSISEWIRELARNESRKTAPRMKEAENNFVKQAVQTALNENSQAGERSRTSSTRREYVKLHEVELSTRSHLKPKRVLIAGDDAITHEKLKSKLLKSGVIVDTLNMEDITSTELYFDRLKPEEYPSWIVFMSTCNSAPEKLLDLCKRLKSINSIDDSFTTELVVITSMGGYIKQANSGNLENCHKLVSQSALAGMASTISREFDFVKTVKLDFEHEVDQKIKADWIIKAASSADSGAEYSFSEGKVYSPFIIPAALNLEKTERTIQLDKSSLILVTGGARGITSEISLELARKYRCNFIIVGQSQEPEPEDSSTRHLIDMKDIKKALMEKTKNIREVESKYRLLMKEREIRDNLSNLKKHAASVKYFSMDVKDEEKFGELLDSLYELNGNIDAVIHGAGIIEDAFIQNKSNTSFRKVFDTKVSAALTLARKLRFDRLKFLYFFSSIIGRVGNPGQIDYSAANETLNKLAQVLNQKSSCEVKSLMWGPWRGGMAPPELERVIEGLGWGMISLDAGRKAFMDELIHSNKDEAEVILVGNPTNATRLNAPVFKSILGPAIRPSEITSHQPFTLSVPVDIEYHDYLHDHCLDGMPVLPMAMAVEMILETAALFQSGRTVGKLENFEIPSGVIFDSNSKQFEISIEQLGLNRASATVHSIGKKKKLHHKCTIDYRRQILEEKEITTGLGSTIPLKYNPDLITASVSDAPTVDSLYQNWLFHGKRFQGIDSIERLGINGIAGAVRGHTPSFCFNQEIETAWILNPTLFDCSLQLALVWARYHFDITCLPTGFKAMQIFKPAPSDNAFVHIFVSDKAGDGEIICDLAIYDSKGDLSTVFEGLTGVGSKSFNRFATRVYA